MRKKVFLSLRKKYFYVIEKAYSKQKWEDALSLISACAEMFYYSNYVFKDDYLEDKLKLICNELKIQPKSFQMNDTIFFYDGFGENSRGLVQVYLNAAVKMTNVVYVTYEDRKEHIPDVIRIIKDTGNKIEFIDRTNRVCAMKDLNNLIQKYTPKWLLLYTMPWDTIGVPIFNLYEGISTRYQINLTDHTFWLGIHAFDKCIEFRNFGTYLSLVYRKISKEKLIVLPYYPAVNENVKFEGYPFPYNPETQKLIFSGGSIHKTLGCKQLYYKMVTRILEENDNTIFWYAGEGNRKYLKNLKLKFPNRVYYTEERADLLQVLKHCDIYLNTYPISGGLMLQYSVLASRIPVSLKHDDDIYGVINKDVQKAFTFDDVSDLCNEVSRLLNNESYRKVIEKTLSGAIITEKEFNAQFSKLLTEEKTDYVVDTKPVNINVFQENHEHNFSLQDAYAILVNSKEVVRGKYLPLEFLIGGVYKVLRHFST